MQRIALPTFTVNEIVDLYIYSKNATEFKANKQAIAKVKKLMKAKVTKHQWKTTFEVVKDAPVTYYWIYDKKANSVLTYGIGMVHRTTQGRVLVSLNSSFEGWHKIYTSHFCERYAERVMKLNSPTFGKGIEGIMFNDHFAGIGQEMDRISEYVVKMQMKYEFGMGFGYMDFENKITWLNTVIGNDMLQGDQRGFADEVEEAIDLLNEQPLKIGFIE